MSEYLRLPCGHLRSVADVRKEKSVYCLADGCGRLWRVAKERNEWTATEVVVPGRSVFDGGAA